MREESKSSGKLNSPEGVLGNNVSNGRPGVSDAYAKLYPAVPYDELKKIMQDLATEYRRKRESGADSTGDGFAVEKGE